MISGPRAVRSRLTGGLLLGGTLLAILSYAALRRPASRMDEYWHLGSCPAHSGDVVTDFEPKKYDGHWFAAYLNRPDPLSRCIDSEITLKAGTIDLLGMFKGAWKVYSSVQKVRVLTGELAPRNYRTGYLDYAVDTSVGKLIGVENYDPKTWFTDMPGAPYEILATDYTSYAVVYNCYYNTMMSWPSMYSHHVWILTREDEGDLPKILAKAKEVMEEQGLDWDKLEMQFMPQGSENGCKYDAGVTIGLGMSGIMSRMPTGLWARDLPTAAARDLPTAAAPAAEEEEEPLDPLTKLSEWAVSIMGYLKG